MNKIKHILLIDDDEATNFLNQIVLQHMQCVEKISIIESAHEALEFLTTTTTNIPNFIFLDINMPAMNGWEFIEEYRNQPSIDKSGTSIFMLTTSSNPDDRTRAEGIEEIKEFLLKPLEEDVMQSLLEKYSKSQKSTL